MARFILDVATNKGSANQSISNTLDIIERDHFLSTQIASIICIDETNENQQYREGLAHLNNLTDKQIRYFEDFNLQCCGKALSPFSYINPLDFKIEFGNPYEDNGFKYLDIFAYDKKSLKSHLLCSASETNAYEALWMSQKTFDSFIASKGRMAFISNELMDSEIDFIESIISNSLEVLDWSGKEYWRDDIRMYCIEATLSDGIESSTAMFYDPYLINIITQPTYGNMFAVQVVINGIERPVMIQAAHFGYIEKIDMDSSLYQVVGDHLKTLEDGKFFIEETFNIPSENLTLVLSEEYEKGDDMFKDLIAVVDNKPFLLYSPFSMGGEQAPKRIDHITKPFINNNFKYLSFETEYDVPIDELVAKITKLTVSVQSIKEIKYKFMGKEYSLHNVHIYDVELAEHITLLVYDETLMNAIRFQSESAIEEAIKTLKDAGYSVSKNGTIV